MSAEAGESSLLFKWETLTEIGPYDLPYESPIPGKMYEVELISGHVVRVWRGEDKRTYFCHGLTFGGKDAPGGSISPFSGKDVNVILEHHFAAVVPESSTVEGDILVWHDPDGNTPHSAIVGEPAVLPGSEYLDYASKILTKNGIQPETVMTLEKLITAHYGENYTVYRRL